AQIITEQLARTYVYRLLNTLKALGEPVHCSVMMQGYDDIRALHSFPTRRSSDLVSSPAWWQASAPLHRLPVLLAPLALLSLACPDRKSTRLNSSHVKISYAVFCLKKKKEKKETNTA